MSSLRSISASIIQGSAIGPASYVVNASDLHAVTDGNELCKYADDTYIIIPAVNAGSRSAELCSITDWACKNNLKLNLAKSQEIIFIDKRRKVNFSAPVIMPELQRVQVIKILGVILTNGLSVSLHVQTVITSCAQTLYALRVLRAHGLCQSALQIIFRAVVVAKLMYGSSAWWGFASATDRQKLKAFLRRSVRAGFYTPDPEYDFHELCNEADHRLFNIILQSEYHVLEQLLPPALPQTYDFRKRPHTRQIPNRCSYLTDCNFLIRMLFADSY